jgi:type IV fimbrial biogenesis protein FimT
MQKPSSVRNIKGFTLIELMVTVAVLVVLISIAVPSFQSAIASSSLRSATNDVMTSLAQTRSTASKMGRRATMCMSSDGVQCATTAGWEQGWIIFSDLTHSGTTASVDSGDAVNYVYPPAPKNIVIVGASGFTQYISYSADGQGKTNTGATLFGKIRVCSTSTSLDDASRARDLVMSFSGRVIIQKPVVAATCPAPT